jgi:predicted TIM-barrel fold metal-dependent hydrolase
MMDAFYMFADEEPADERPAAWTPMTDDLRALFADHAAAMAERVLAAVSADARSGVAQDIEGVIAQRVEALRGESGVRAARSEGPADIELSAGYAEHLRELEELAGDHAGQVFPFLAVDPRRRGIVDLVKRKVSRRGPFYGVKVYPPLGYYPDHRVLQEVYAYCLSEDLPITVHAQPSSFPHAGYTRVEAGLKFANPERWAPILEKHRGLRVNFAHFGGIDQARAYAENPGTSEDNWTRTIVGLMQHDNVYADTSAYAEPDAAQIVDDILRWESHVAERLMFGTDYVICLLNPHVNWRVEAYFDGYPSIAGSSYAQALFHDNALRFANVP